MSKKPKFSSKKRSAMAHMRRRPNVRIEDLDYRNIEVLKKFVSEQGKLLSRQYTGLPARFQRRLARAIKRARNTLLIK